MKSILTLGVLLPALLALACETSGRQKTVLLGVTRNIHTKCVGHSGGLCGPRDELMPVDIAGVFATEPECQGLRLRGLTPTGANDL